ncbi:MAG: hypothetical protein ABIJ12_03195 [bacterium]
MSIVYPIIRLFTLIGGIVFLFMAMNNQKPDKQMVGRKIILNKEKVREYFENDKGYKYYWISLSLFFAGLLFTTYELIIEYLL